MLVTNNTVDATTTYFLPGRWGGDHSFKGGYKYGHYGEVYDRHYSGHAQSVFNSARTAADLQHTVHGAGDPRLHHAGLPRPALRLSSGHVLAQAVHGDLGFRWDRQADKVAAVNIPAHAFQGQPTIDGTPFNLLPALDVPERRAGVVSGTPLRRDSASPTTSPATPPT